MDLHTWEMEAGGLLVQGQPGLPSETLLSQKPPLLLPIADNNNKTKQTKTTNTPPIPFGYFL
jgi:hypothetical protein